MRLSIVHNETGLVVCVLEGEDQETLEERYEELYGGSNDHTWSYAEYAGAYPNGELR